MNTVIPHLQELLNSIDITKLPYEKGNVIYIGNSCVKKTAGGYKIFKRKKFVAETFSKIAAVILAKEHVSLINFNKIKNLDMTIEKHFNDCVFYKNILNSSSNYTNKQVLENRLQISTEKIKFAFKELSNILFVN